MGFELHGNAVKASVFCIEGDNLGSHNIGGLNEIFRTTKSLCQYCHVTREDLNPAQARSEENYNQQ